MVQLPDLDRITQAVVKVVAPESLSINKADDDLTPEERRAAACVAALQPGDLILVSTPGAFYSFFRSVTRQPYDHIAGVVTADTALHIGPYKARLLPIARFLTPSRHPLVLRPTLSNEERQNFVSALEGMIGQDYNLVQVFDLIVRLTMQRHFGIHMPAVPQPAGNSASFGELAGTGSDANALGAASISDFVDFYRQHPDLLQRVELPSLGPGGDGRDEAAISEPGDEIGVDASAWESALVIVRASLLRVVPHDFRNRFESMLRHGEARMVHIPVPVIVFLYIGVIIAVYRRYPLPALLAFLGPVLNPPPAAIQSRL
ncbi:unnamed protein product (mitochondrion) [Plasmodiophora brassicae]|uniref:Uncharacterized protein n=1 Tax=Plasmodiophora brassicae TaxID=37360 RepID=A0A3P3Y8L0_PLABS|nr:unnamed protein product [Plasmodiophora brassicae]